MLDEAERLRGIVRAALLTLSPLAKYHPGPRRRTIEEDIVLSAGTIAGREFRHVLVLGPASPERVLALATSFFARADDFTIELAVEWAGALDQALTAQGWRCEEEEPAL